MTSKKHPQWMKGILVVGIVIVLNLFFNYAIKVVYDAPKWDEYCPQEQVTITPETQEACVAAGGGWTTNQHYGRSVPAPAGYTEPAGYCDLYFTCQKEFAETSTVYNRNVFVALVILGIISVLIGFAVKQSEAVSLGLSLGGVLSFIIGSIRYWSDMDDYLRVIVLGVALGILIWLGVKKIRD